MDRLSITATCVGLTSTITRTSLLVIDFVKDVRAARSDLDDVSRKLHYLKTEQLPRDMNQRRAGFMLERCLENLTTYAETVCDLFLDGLDPLVFNSDPKDLKSPCFENWLLEMKKKLTADDWEAVEETKMAYIQNRVGGLAFKLLEPRLRPGCEHPFTSGDEIFQDLTQIFADQDFYERAWVKKNQSDPQLISPKSLETSSAESQISITTSSPISQEVRDQFSKAEIADKQSSKQRYVP
ncbi:unnamed protein product [Sphagnum balticum]